MDEIRKRVQGAFILKHCDRYTAGIPDLSVSFKYGKGTTWVEVKEVGGKGIFKPTKGDFALQQLDFVESLALCGPAYYAVFTEDHPSKRRMFVVHPRSIRAAMAEKQTFEIADGSASTDVNILVDGLLMRCLKEPCNWSIKE